MGLAEIILNAINCLPNLIPTKSDKASWYFLDSSVKLLLVIFLVEESKLCKSSSVFSVLLLTADSALIILSLWVQACDHLVIWEFTSSLCAAEYINTLPALSRWVNK